MAGGQSARPTTTSHGSTRTNRRGNASSLPDVWSTRTAASGRYVFTTIKPGAYPWRNHHNAWRPAHIHFSLFGTNFLGRLVTQMYFPGDPLLAHDPIFQSIPHERTRQRLIARFDAT